MDQLFNGLVEYRLHLIAIKVMVNQLSNCITAFLTEKQITYGVHIELNLIN
jgi:hypothetical protein